MSATRRLIVWLVLAVFVVGLSAALAAPAARAETAAELQQKLREARAKIAAAEKDKASLNDQIADLDGRLTAIEDELAGLGDRIAAVQERLAVTRDKLDVLREELRLKRRELRKAEEKLRVERDNFERRVVLSYKSDDLSYLDVIMASSSFEELVSTMTTVQRLIGGNDDLVGDYVATRDEVREEKDAIASRESDVRKAVADLEKKSDQLAALRAAQAASQAQALAMRQEKAGALADVNSNLTVLEQQEQELAAESAAISGVINGSSGGGGGTGSMVWPVSGPITSSFGWRTNPISGHKEYHPGIDIGVAYGTPIKAADSGTVIAATWYTGYGNVIIIDHGKGVSTLYAHQSSLAVGSGAHVSRGQTIGYVGSTGYSTGPHLHFEVRVSGSPVNPLGYL